VTPTWYDLLGVEADASEEQIRIAWKSGIADLEPGERRFRTLNEAAEVLLDPARRAEYDAGLAPAVDDKTQLAPPLTRQKLPGGAKRGRSVSAGPGETTDGLEALDATQPLPDSRTTARRTIPAWLLAALAALTLLMVVAAAYLAGQPSDDAIADATSDAQGSAERAAVTILAYDYRTLDEDQRAAGALMTSAYKKKYDQLFEVIKENSEAVKPVVTVDVVASGVVRSGDDRVQVLVFVNRPTTNAKSQEPTVFRDQVRITMVKSGDDWLVDDMQTSPTAG
jgi:Mce-associated membrane protein